MERALDSVDAWMTGLVLTWGTAFVAIKVLGGTLDPYQLTWFRYAPFLVLFGIWLALRRRDRFRRVTGPDWIRFAVAGALAVLGYHLPLNWGLSPFTGDGTEVSGATGAILVATTPLWTLLFAVSTGQERFDQGRLLGSVTAFVGVGIVVFLGTGETDFTAAVKTLVILIAPICWGTYSILAKPLIGRYGGLFVTGVTMCIGTLMLLPLGLRYGITPLQDFTPRLWGWYLFLSLAATVGGYAVWNHALKQRAASEVTTYIYLIPVVATAAGWLLIEETVTAWFLVGAGLVLVGVVQVHRARVRAAVAPPVPAAKA